jgi:DNA-binding CsgD family transcriptional regulator
VTGAVDPHPLDALIRLDSLREIFAAMTPAELVIALLRARGWTDSEIAETLGISTAAVARTMDRASERILRTQPRDVASLVRGRRREPAPRPPAPRRAKRPPAGCLSTAQVARLLGVSPKQVRCWCQDGRFPHAYQAQDGNQPWFIPVADLDALQEPEP